MSHDQLPRAVDVPRIGEPPLRLFRPPCPLRGTRIDLAYGARVHLDAQPFPRTQEQIRTATAFLHGAPRAHLDAARALTVRELPGPIPTETPSPTDSTKEHIDD